MANAGREACQEALREGHPVVFKDEQGRYVQEHPDGKLFEVRLDRPEIAVIREFHKQAA